MFRAYKSLKGGKARLVLIIFLTILTSKAHSQIDTAHIRKAGIEMVKYEKQYTAGVMIGIVGVGVAVAATSSDTNNKPLAIGGGVLSLIGFIIQISASDHIKKAGIYLQGKSVVIPLHK
jgi:hypothetical protein